MNDKLDEAARRIQDAQPWWVYRKYGCTHVVVGGGEWHSEGNYWTPQGWSQSKGYDLVKNWIGQGLVPCGTLAIAGEKQRK